MIQFQAMKNYLNYVLTYIEHLEEENIRLREQLKEAKHTSDGYFRTLEYIKETIGPLITKD